MIRLIYKTVQKVMIDADGITQVTLDTDGTLIELGTVTVKKGSKNFKAILLDGTNLDGKYNTKKQAGGALQKHYNGVDKVIAPHPVAAAPVEESKVVEPTPQPVLEIAEKPIVAPVQSNYVIPFTMADVLDEDFDGDSFPEMPEFLRRDLWSDEERELNSVE